MWCRVAMSEAPWGWMHGMANRRRYPWDAERARPLNHDQVGSCICGLMGEWLGKRISATAWQRKGFMRVYPYMKRVRARFA